MTTIARGEVVTLTGASGRDRHVSGTFRATADLDVEALLREFAEAVPEAEHGGAMLPVLAGRLGDAVAASAFGRWLLDRRLVERIEARVLDLRVRRDEAGAPTVVPRLTGEADVRRPMRPDIRRAWVDEAVAIEESLRGMRDVRGPVFHGVTRTVATLLEASGLRWDDAVAAGIAARYAGTSAADHRYPAPGMTSIGALRLAWAVVTDDAATVPDPAREALSRHLARTRPEAAIARDLARRPGTTSARIDGPVAFPFAFAEDGPRGRWVTGVGSHVLEPVDASEAPVAAVLLGPSSGRVTVRVVDGRTYREVLSPGSWEPMSAEAFLRAAAAGEAWRDDPFACATERTAWVSDVFGPRDLGRRPLPGDADPALAEAVSARVGRVILVDGHVLVGCPAPTLRTWFTTRSNLWGRDVGLTWSLGPRLHGVNGQWTSTLLAPRERPVLPSPGCGTDVHWGRLVDGVTLVLARDLAQAMRAFSEATRERVLDLDRGGVGFGVEWFDPDLLPPPDADLPSLIRAYCEPDDGWPQGDDARSPEAWEELAARLRWGDRDDEDDFDHDASDEDDAIGCKLAAALAETHARKLREAADRLDFPTF